MEEINTVDGKYYQVVKPGSLAEAMAIKARNQIYLDMQRYCSPGPETKVLDVGVSDVLTGAANFFEQAYPYKENITAAGLGEAIEFQASFEMIRYVRVEADAPLPFADNEFDLAVSNAVLEHVGSDEGQRLFVSEMCRVSRKTFITVPHRYFPVEPHTGFPVVHYLDSTFNIACKALGKTEWAEERNLIMMTKSKLRRLAPPQFKHTIRWTGLKIGPVSSNLLLYVEK